MITFTVVTITFNAAKVVSRTLKSVERQTWQAIEHIIIDGASTDKTLDIVADYVNDSRKYHSPAADKCSANDSHASSLGSRRTQPTSSNPADGGKETTAPRHVIRVFSEPDSGIYDAMNKGLRHATGDYVVFINAGDCLHDAHTLENIARNTGLDSLTADSRQWPAVIYGDTDITDGDGVYICRRKHRPPRKLSWKSFRQGMLVCHQAFYARRDIAAATPFDMNYRYSADIDWCIRVMKEAENMRLPLVNAGITVADYMREGLSTIHHRASLMERFAIMRRHYGLFSTLVMHVWFVLRAAWRKITGR